MIGVRERLYWAGFPTTPLGWVGYGLLMLVGIVGTLLLNDLPAAFLVLLLASWVINLGIIHWSFQSRLVCHLAFWVLLWRAIDPSHPWYRVLLLSALMAGGVVWVQEQRKMETGPVG